MELLAVIERTKKILVPAILLLASLSASLAGQSADRMWAAQTGPDQVTLAWDSTPGAMEYRICLGAPGGPGAAVHLTNQATPGGTPAATTPGQQVPTTTTATAATVHTATPVTTTPTTTATSTPSTAMPLGELAGSLLTHLDQIATPTGATTQTTAVHAATPVTSTATTTTTATPTTSNLIHEIADGVRDAAGNLTSALSGSLMGNLTATVSPPTSVAARVSGPGAVLVTWQASPTTGVTNYRVNRRVNGGAWESMISVDPYTLTYSDTFFQVTMFASGPALVSYNVVALKATAFTAASTTGDLVVRPTVPGASTPSESRVATACKLDYQRADYTWAAFGRPDGPLGIETIPLSPGQGKVFITDLKYEKTRNDGSNYFGSHLRFATNSSSSTIRLQIRSLTVTGLVVFPRTGSDTFWMRMDPGSTRQFQADLMEVFCER